MLTKKTATSGQMILLGILVLLLGLSSTNAQSRQAEADFHISEHRASDRAAREAQESRDRANRKAEADFHISEHRAQDREAREAQERAQERRTNEMNRIADALRDDRAQTERNLRERQQTQDREQVQGSRQADRDRERQQNQERFQRDWELGEHLRRENEGSGFGRYQSSPANRVRVSPQPPSRNTPQRNSWEGEYDEIVRDNERRREQQRRTNEMNRIGAALNADRVQTERYLRERNLPTIRQQIVERQPFGNPNSYFEARRPSPYGHQYDAYGYFGASANLGAEQAFSTAISRGMSYLIPSEPIGTRDDSIAVGKRFNLHHYLDFGRWIDAPVEVIEVTKTSFTVRTLPGHPLQGTVTHEIIKDRNNEFWLHQRGTGVDLEPRGLQEFNYRAASGMWPIMTERVGLAIFGPFR
ncbi:MAG: DUF1990 family protein [Pyrinomonadaceae bacterium]